MRDLEASPLTPIDLGKKIWGRMRRSKPHKRWSNVRLCARLVVCFQASGLTPRKYAAAVGIPDGGPLLTNLARAKNVEGEKWPDLIAELMFVQFGVTRTEELVVHSPPLNPAVMTFLNKCAGGSRARKSTQMAKALPSAQKRT